MNMLLLDASDKLRPKVKAILEHNFEGVQVTECTNAQSALEAIVTSEFKLIICGPSVPDMTQVEFLKNTRVLKTGLCIGFIAGANQALMNQELKELGAEFILEPPLNLEAFNQALAQVR